LILRAFGKTVDLLFGVGEKRGESQDHIVLDTAPRTGLSGHRDVTCYGDIRCAAIDE
jgi:hypothetical protein